MTSLMPETIEPATGGSAGGPGGTLPLPKPLAVRRKPRVAWTQAEVAALVTAFHTPKGLGTADFSERDTAKLIELGLMDKPAKAVLTNEGRDTIDEFVREVGTLPEWLRPLAARYAIKRFQELLPKRAPK